MSSDLLLPEILSRVFTFLHIEDKKSVRLVCHKWNEACNCPAIIRTEKFVFRGGHEMSTINVFLKKCARLRSTIEFQGLPLLLLPDDRAWRLRGPEIHSLSFIECEVSNRTTRNICLHCPNMHSFKSTNQFRHGNSTVLNGFCSLETLDRMIRLNVERPKVISFQLLINGVEIAKEILRRIFKIFPCIENFGTGYSSFTSYIFQGTYHGSLDHTFNPALIKELSFNLPSSGLWMREFSTIPELKLRKLETILRQPYFFDDTLLSQFLRNQNELQTLKIRTLGSDDDQTKMVLFKILSTCLNLTDFRFKCDVTLKMDEFFQLFQAVSQSKLECVVLWFKSLCSADDPIFDDDLSAYLAPFMNKTLRTLKLAVSVAERLCLPILEHFSNLCHLELAAVTDSILQTIFQHHVRLETLVLRRTDNCTAFGFIGRDALGSTPEKTTYSISRLRELRHLEIEGFLSHRWIERTVMEFNFPLLRYLRLSLWGLEEEVTNRTFEHLPTVIPSVEILIVDEIPFKGQQYVYFCKNLQRLRLLLYGWIGDERTIRELFLVRPSLKYAVDLSDNAYFYDRFKDDLRIVNFRDIEFRKSVFCDFIRS